VNVLKRFIALSIVPIVSILLALFVGAIIIVLSSLEIEGSLNLMLPIVAYESLIEGATGISFLDVEDGVIAVAFSIEWELAARNLSNTLTQAAPLILSGLAVGLGFKGGLFNIGGSGQVLVGGFAAGLVGAAVAGLPAPIAVTVALLAGCLGGAFYGFIPGALKAFRGAHEVVTTIMLNSLAALVLIGLVNDIFKIQGPTFARTADVGNAKLPIWLGNEGIFEMLIALGLAALAYVLIYRTTLGFEIRTTGANPSAARYAGMSPRRLTILTMSMCGLFAGLAGALLILAQGYYPATFGTTIGFAGITVALLGRANPIGIVLAALLLGAMSAGAGAMQISADIKKEIIDVIQGLILLFLAAESVIRRLLRIRAERVTPGELETVSRSYGQAA
jgi:simple sugar transport system permease protein